MTENFLSTLTECSPCIKTNNEISQPLINTLEKYVVEPSYAENNLSSPLKQHASTRKPSRVRKLLLRLVAVHLHQVLVLVVQAPLHHLRVKLPLKLLCQILLKPLQMMLMRTKHQVQVGVQVRLIIVYHL